MAEMKDRIREAMIYSDMTSSSLAKKTGMAASSISQYLSGKTKPSDRAIRLIAEALDVTPGYLAGTEERETDQESSKNLTCERIARLMGKSKEFVRKGLQQGVFPWGYAVKTSSKWSYFISGEKFTEATGIKIV